MTYIEHFNTGSEKYFHFRPSYPDRLFDYLSTLVSEKARVWDCGTGNGQAALSLAKKFNRVIGTDIHLHQMEAAPREANVNYICCAAEKTPFLDKAIDLITVAQALHWFNLEKFYEEVRRVAKSSSVIAVWCYSLGTIDLDVDPFLSTLYTDILGDQYWPKERRYIDEHYRTIAFPFKQVSVPDFTIEKKFDFSSLIGYLNTWSAVKEYKNLQHTNPIAIIHDELLSAWGNPKLQRVMRWRIHLLVGMID